MSVSVKCILIYFFRDFSLTINIGLSDMNIKLNDKIAITENIANMLFGLIKLPFVPIIFKNLLPSANPVKYDLAIYNTGDIPNIGSMKNQISYIETQFHLFDNYVFSHWHEGPLDISRE